MKYIKIYEKKDSNEFEEFAEKRLIGATKIAKNAKEKGGLSMLTYQHFNVKLPFYKKASEGKLNIKEAKEELAKEIDKLCLMTKEISIDQIEFQKLVGIIEVLGELIIQHKE